MATVCGCCNQRATFRHTLAEYHNIAQIMSLRLSVPSPYGIFDQIADLCHKMQKKCVLVLAITSQERLRNSINQTFINTSPSFRSYRLDHPDHHRTDRNAPLFINLLFSSVCSVSGIILLIHVILYCISNLNDDVCNVAHLDS